MTEQTSPTALAGLALSKLHGAFAWSCRPGIGTFFTMEFGEPHLRVREPRISSRPMSERVRDVLARRQVFTEGDYTLWVCNARWILETREGVLADATAGPPSVPEAVAAIDGRRLLGHDVVGSPAFVTLHFEDGVSLHIRGAADVTGLHVWSFHRRSVDTLAVGADGGVSVEPG